VQKSYQQQVGNLIKSGVSLEDAIIHAECEHAVFIEHVKRNELTPSISRNVRKLDGNLRYLNGEFLSI
jgi:hypothetical protein